MAEPWKKYAGESGPWSKYGTTPSEPEQPGFVESFVAPIKGLGSAVVKSFTGKEYRAPTLGNIIEDVTAPVVSVKDKLDQGNYRGAAGEILGNLALLAGPKIARGTASAAKATARGVSSAAQNPTVQAVGRAAVESVPVAGPLVTGVYDAVQAAKRANMTPPTAGALPIEMPAAAVSSPAMMPASEAAQMSPRAVMGLRQGPKPALEPIPEAPIPPMPEWAQGLTPGQWKALSRSGHSEVLMKGIAERLTRGKVLREVPPSTAVSSAAPEPIKVVSIRPPRGKGVAQGSKDARALADKLTEWNFTPDEANQMNTQGWAKLAHETGVPMPTAATRNSALFALKKKLAGPERTIPEMLDSLRKDLGMKPSARAIAEALKAEMDKH